MTEHIPDPLALAPGRDLARLRAAVDPEPPAGG